jgi:hypothetical protein
MAEDASLDDFLDAGSEADDEGTASDADGTASSGTAGDDGTGDAAPAVTDPGRSTFDWSPSGAECGACGAVVERRWRDGDGMVCEACKEW